jgi:hypothetical protein
LKDISEKKMIYRLRLVPFLHRVTICKKKLIVGFIYLLTHFYLGPGLRICGVIPPIPLYAFMAWTGRSLPLTFTSLYHAETWLGKGVERCNRPGRRKEHFR